MAETLGLQLLDEPKRHLPRDVARIHIHCDELAEWRRRARNLVLRIPEPADGTAPWRAPGPCNWSIGTLPLDHLRDLAQIHHVRDQQAEFRVVREPVPVAPT